MPKNKAPEQTRREKSPGREKAEGFDAIAEGTHGRGPTPYTKGMSPKPNGHGSAPHMATAGRGGDGQIGKGDGFKSRTSDIAHPDSHGAFESLGVDD
jgi:hypothetical protein